MIKLLYVFKQGNKILAKIYKENDKYSVQCAFHSGSCLAFSYDLCVNAVLKTHNYISGLLSIKKNQNYSMLEYEYISQYCQIYKYIYNNGVLIKDGKLHKTIVA